MAKYHDIQILRGTKEAIEANADYTLYDGQPLYDKTSNLLYVGNGSRSLEESVPVSTQSIQHTDGSEFKLDKKSSFVISNNGVDTTYQSYELSSTNTSKVIQAKYAEHASKDTHNNSIYDRYIRHNEHSIKTADIDPGAVTESVLDKNSVTTDKINDLAVTANKIQDGTITSDKFESNAVCPTASVANNSLKINGLSITKDPTTGILKFDGNVIPYKVLLWEGSVKSTYTISGNTVTNNWGEISLSEAASDDAYYEIEYETYISTDGGDGYNRTAKISTKGSVVTVFVDSSPAQTNLRKLWIRSVSFQYRFAPDSTGATKLFRFAPCYYAQYNADRTSAENAPVQMTKSVDVGTVTVKRIYKLIG